MALISIFRRYIALEYICPLGVHQMSIKCPPCFLGFIFCNRGFFVFLSTVMMEKEKFINCTPFLTIKNNKHEEKTMQTKTTKRKYTKRKHTKRKYTKRTEIKPKKKNVTLSIDEKIYETYQKFCNEKGYNLSRQLEIFMQDHFMNQYIKN